MGKTFLEAQKEAGKEAKQSIRPDAENKMQSGTRPGQRGNNLDRNDPQSLISGTNQQPTKGAKGQQKLHTISRTKDGVSETKQVTQEEWKKGGYHADGWTRTDGDEGDQS